MIHSEHRRPTEFSRIIIHKKCWNLKENNCSNCDKQLQNGEKVFLKRAKKRKRYCLICATKLNLITEETPMTIYKRK